MKGKMNLPLKEFLTLVGPAQVLHIIEEGETEPAFKDRSVKIRDHEELLDREVKFIQPAADTENAGKYIDGEPDGSGKAEKEKTKITLSRTIAAGSEAIKITNTPSVYDTLGMTEEELEAIKADLQQ